MTREHVSLSHVLWLALMLCDGDEASHCADGGSSTLFGPLSFISTSLSVTYDGFFSPIFLDLKHKSLLVTTVIMTHPT